jgi:hypothetical protein
MAVAAGLGYAVRVCGKAHGGVEGETPKRRQELHEDSGAAADSSSVGGRADWPRGAYTAPTLVETC